MENTKLAPQLFAALSGTVIIIGAGFTLGWASPSLPKLLADTSIPVTPNQSTWIVSLMMAGGLFGPLVSLMIVDRWGRKTSMLLLSTPLLLSCILIAFAQNYWWYYAGRFISGIGLGGTFTIVPMYLGEIAEDRIRGSLGILVSVMLNLGFLLPYCAGPWVSVPVLAGLGALIPVVYVLTFTWMPEAPHYYIMKDQPDRARKSLEWLRGTQNVDEEIEKMTKSVEHDLSNVGTLKELFTDVRNRKALLIIIGVLSAQQISGTAVILSYSTLIFNEVASGISSSVSVVITGVVQLVASIFVVFLADRAGRRTLLLISSFFSAIFLIGEAVYFHLKANETDVSGISWLPVTSIIGYLCSYTLGLGTLPMSLISEIFSHNFKAYATTISALYLSLAATFVSQLYPAISNAYGIHAGFYMFALGTILLMIFIYYYLPETRGKSFSEIQEMLEKRSHSQSNCGLEGTHTTKHGISNSAASIATIDLQSECDATIVTLFSGIYIILFIKFSGFNPVGF